MNISRDEVKKIKNKIRLWCVLHSVKMENRHLNGKLVYQESCDICRKKNGGDCIGIKKIDTDTSLLFYDTRKKILYRNVQIKRANKQARKNRYLWCVEWIKHV